MQIKGLIPLIYAIVHPIAVLWVLKIFNSLFSCSDSKEEDMITGKVSSTPRNSYLRCDGKGFNSSLVVSLLKVIPCPRLVATVQI